MQIVVFQLGEEKYGIDTLKVQGINKMADVTTVPGASSSIKGLINLRGNIISVIDPYIALGINSKNVEKENIIIVETEDEVSGIIVDKVIEVLDIDNQVIKNISGSAEEENEYIKGTINMGGYLVTLINVDVLLCAK
jgi:purine-binding chemotaxis protein CheW